MHVGVMLKRTEERRISSLLKILRRRPRALFPSYDLRYNSGSLTKPSIGPFLLCLNCSKIQPFLYNTVSLGRGTSVYRPTTHTIHCTEDSEPRIYMYMMKTHWDQDTLESGTSTVQKSLKHLVNMLQLGLLTTCS